MRGGTENTYGIIGLAKALEIAYREMDEHQKYITGLKARMIEKLKQEISLDPCDLEFPKLFGSEDYELFSGMVPVGNDIFRRIVVRASKMPQIDPRAFSLLNWTERAYYEVCASPAVYAALEKKSAAAK